jgi:hypothetical protein
MQWYGQGSICGQNYEWFYSGGTRGRLVVREQDKLVPQAWMNCEPPGGTKKAILKAIREAKIGNPAVRG